MPSESNDTSSKYNEIADKYAETYSEPSEMTEMLAEKVKNGRILDAGCGPGSDARFLASKDFEVVGVDISERMIEKAREQVPEAEFRVGDLREMEFENDSFDGIISSFSLIHLSKSEIWDVVSSFADFLRPGGFLYAAFQEGEKKKGEVTSPLDEEKEFSLTVLPENKIRKIVEESGFQIMRCEILEPGENDLEFNKLHVIARLQ